MKLFSVAGVGLGAVALAFGAAYLVAQFGSGSERRKPTCDDTSRLAVLCESCIHTIDTTITISKSVGLGAADVVNLHAPTLAGAVCNFFKVLTPRTCAGYIENRISEVVYIFQNTEQTPEEICTSYLGVSCTTLISKFVSNQRPDIYLPRRVMAAEKRVETDDRYKKRGNRAAQWGIALPPPKPMYFVPKRGVLYDEDQNVREPISKPRPFNPWAPPRGSQQMPQIQQISQATRHFLLQQQRLQEQQRLQTQEYPPYNPWLPRSAHNIPPSERQSNDVQYDSNGKPVFHQYVRGERVIVSHPFHPVLNPNGFVKTAAPTRTKFSFRPVFNPYRSTTTDAISTTKQTTTISTTIKSTTTPRPGPSPFPDWWYSTRLPAQVTQSKVDTRDIPPLKPDQAVSVALAVGAKALGMERFGHGIYKLGWARRGYEGLHDETPRPTMEPRKPVEPTPMVADAIRVLHLTDIHFDDSYVAGSVANCGEILCCRKDSPKEKNKPIIHAGDWGSYEKCDLPYKTLVTLFDDLRRQKFDYVMWTGDLTPHDGHGLDAEIVTHYLQELQRLFRLYFPDVPVFSAVGNHDTHPVNSFTQPTVESSRFSMRWLYDELSRLWGSTEERTPTSQARSTEYSDPMERGAFYSRLVRPGLRLVALNGQFCYMLNFWLALRDKDPAQELEWLVAELTEAESKDESVHILTHIPPGGDDCLLSWSWNFNQIVSRFNRTVKAVYSGHDHREHFQLYYADEVDAAPTVTGYVGPSLTTWKGLRPAYRVYDINPASFVVDDFHTFHLDLDTANQRGINYRPRWEHAYSAKAAFDLPDLSPQSWEDFAKRMLTDEAMLRRFYGYLNRYERNRPDLSRKQMLDGLCGLLSARTMDPLVCERLGLPFRNDLAKKIFGLCIDKDDE